MNRCFHSLSLVAILFVAISCEKSSDSQERFVEGEVVEFIPTYSAQSRVIDNQFEDGDIAIFDAYDEDGELYLDNISYTYSTGIFSSTTPIAYTSVHPQLSFVACYPSTKSLAKSFTYAVTTDQSEESSYEANDLLVARVELCQEAQPTIQFQHAMSSVVMNIVGASSYSNIVVNAQNNLLCNTETMSFTAYGDNEQITPLWLGDDKYMVLLAPQSIAKGDKFLSATIGDVDYVWSAPSSVALESGLEYEITCNLEVGVVSPSVETYRSGWPELPNEPVEEGVYYYAHHTATLNSATVRNFTACYRGDYICPAWVAGPMHKSYSTGTGSRSDNYTSDPQISCYQVETLGSPYNRGHLIASSDRLGNQALNNQAFYLSNISPQLITGFNTGGGIWNNYEDQIQDWYENRSDTLYIVNGCNWENTNTVVSGTTVPTHYYKALLRCKEANSSKSVIECSSSELECVAFYFEHKSQAGVTPSSSHMISIEALEAKTGFTFFSNVPNAPKSSYSASDWDL